MMGFVCGCDGDSASPLSLSSPRGFSRLFFSIVSYFNSQNERYAVVTALQFTVLHKHRAFNGTRVMMATRGLPRS